MVDARDEREEVLPLAPPRRLMTPDAYRVFKLREDRRVWADTWARITALTDEGWTVRRVHVDWGNRRPATEATCAKEIAGLIGAVDLTQELSGRPGRGETRVTLERE